MYHIPTTLTTTSFAIARYCVLTLVLTLVLSFITTLISILIISLNNKLINSVTVPATSYQPVVYSIINPIPSPSLGRIICVPQRFELMQNEGGDLLIRGSVEVAVPISGVSHVHRGGKYLL